VTKWLVFGPPHRPIRHGRREIRPREDLDEALAHELADCLWCVMTLAEAYDVDLGAAFASTMDSLDESLRSP